MLQIFICQSSISRTSFIYSKSRKRWQQQNRFQRKKAKNNRNKNTLIISYMLYVYRKWFYSGRTFYGLRLVEFYTFLIKNHWLFYTSEKLIFNSSYSVASIHISINLYYFMVNRVRITSSFFYQMCWSFSSSFHFIHSSTFDLFFFYIFDILIFALSLSRAFEIYSVWPVYIDVRACVRVCVCVSSDFVWKYCKKTFPINKIGLYSDRHHLMFRWLRATYTILVKLRKWQSNTHMYIKEENEEEEEEEKTFRHRNWSH